MTEEDTPVDETGSAANASTPSRRRRLNTPLKIGLGAAVLALALAVVGIVRGQVPLNPLSIGLALLISAASWGIVAWLVATAAQDVDTDVAAAEAEATPAKST